MLLIAFVLMISATYAWLILSTHPEVVGISTQIGSNGSLEIALLDARTRADVTSITSKIGDSADVQGAVSANGSWGNLVNLSDSSYGLDKIIMMPAQLLLEGNSTTGFNVRGSGPLALPLYGSDGRITELSENTVSAVYGGGRFSVTGEQTYGVRGIGVVDALSAEQSAIGYAKSNIIAYSGSAKNAAISTINTYGEGLIGIVFKHSIQSEATYGDADINTLKGMITGLKGSFGYVEMAIRYGILANIAQNGSDSFSEAKNDLLDSTISLSSIYETYSGYCPAEMEEWVAKLTAAQNTLNQAYSGCAVLTGNIYTWDEIKPILTPLMDSDYVYLNGSPIENASGNELLNIASFTLTILPGSGVFTDIAYFVGSYSTWINYSVYNIEFVVRTAETTPQLTAMTSTIQGAVIETANTEISNLGGYAIDLAFRCNAAESDLQLQIAPAQRVYSESSAGDLQGGGSYMQFSTQDRNMTPGRMLELMDAIRLTFIDVEGKILAMAKLNTSNHTIQENGSLKANLYLYDYSIENDRTVTIGERRSGDTKIVALEQNVAKEVSVVVWLDGMAVDNTMVSAETNTSLDGVLNLQFASSADLIPAANNALYNSNASRQQLVQLLTDGKDTPTETYEAGQGALYTDVSWKAFAAAYEYAEAVSHNSDASSTQIKAAYNNLQKAFDELEGATHDTLSASINDVREMMGETDRVAGFAKQGSVYTTYTAEFAEQSAQIMQVDYNNNLHDEGNGILTPIYTRDSWGNLANALYKAEAVNLNEAATDTELNDQITLLDNAFASLKRAVFYEAYEMDDEIYYFAISDETDTYGKWYDSDFHRVVNDLTILDLDTSAQKATVAKISAEDYVEYGTLSAVVPIVNLSDNAYAEFKNDEIIGVRWGITGLVFSDINGDAAVSLKSLSETYQTLLNRVPDGFVFSNADKLEKFEAEAKEVTEGTTTKTDAEALELMTEYAAAIAVMADELNAKLEAIAAEKEALRRDISKDEQVVLAAAINEATKLDPETVKWNDEGTGYKYESLEAYLNAKDINLGEADKSRYSALLTAVRDAILVQKKGDDATRTEYNEKLEALNNAIIVMGGTARTIENTIEHTLTGTDGYYEPTNRVVIPSAVLKLSEQTKQDVAATIVTARILTKNGVTYTAEKIVKFYNKADRIMMTKGGVDITGNATVAANDTISYRLVLRKETIDVDGVETDVDLPCNEIPKNYFWSVSDTSKATISVSGGTCTVDEIKDTVTLTLTVEMDTGSTYTGSVILHK